MSGQPFTKKSLGQHWLNDPATLEAICDNAQLTTEDTVLEVGPGPGALTKLLVKQAGQVVAVEFDERFAKALPSSVPAVNLHVEYHDILKFDLTTLPANYKVVANIPYYLTSNLLRTLSESANPPQTIVLLVQKEVAERVAAAPGAMSMLSVSVQLYYQATLGDVVQAIMFTPPPKIDSQVLILQRHPKPLFDDIIPQALLSVVKAGFAARRKTLLNSLSGGLRQEKDQTTQAITAANLSPTMRPQELTLDNWHQLALALSDSPTRSVQ